MVFSSILFIFLFLPLVLIAYYVVKPGWRNYILVLASLILYTWGAAKFVFILLASLLVDFIISQFINRTTAKKILLIVYIGLDLGLLAYFKYANFFINELNAFLINMGLTPHHWTQVILPIGISFITFHRISYIVDVYRGTAKPFKNIMNYFLYILLFPQLIAGPIVRFQEIANQILWREHTLDRFLDGIWRFSIGLARKVLVANTLGSIADNVFELTPDNLNLATAWTGILLYTLQIYYDFSGYSDMAIGLGKMFGFELPENFNRPYIAKSITDFWRRWHMSLSRFFKDYLYIPLGGNRCSGSRNYINLWIVFILCGFWHGANWTFLAWGIYHGMFLVLDKVFLLNRLNKCPQYLANMFTFLVIMIGWVFFRSDTISYALKYISTMFLIKANSFALLVDLDDKLLITLIIVGFFTFSTWFYKYKLLDKINMENLSLIKGSFALLIFFYSCAVLSVQSFNPFIYFKF